MNIKMITIFGDIEQLSLYSMHMKKNILQKVGEKCYVRSYPFFWYEGMINDFFG